MPFVRKEPTGHGYKLLFDDAKDDLENRVEEGDLKFDGPAADLMRRLRRIHDNARTTVEERGVTTLFLTFGALHWRDDWLGESITPLWMVPCQFVSKGPNVALRLSMADEEMQLNPALQLYIRERHKIELPQILDEPDESSLLAFLEAARDRVREQRWDVTEEIWLSTFSFESLVIYQDLEKMADIAATNRIVAALARARSVAEQSERLGEDLDGLPTPEVVPVPVFPTDSSQMEALACAAAGRNLVAHGPPGTGKSQTISNLIADALGRNKKVLFVSAKMAALNVVYERLASKGLGRFCLEAHSTKAGKAKIIDGLRHTLEAEGSGGGGRFAEELEGLLKIRQRLNGYVRDLHRKLEPLDLTPYQLIGKAAKLHKFPDVRAPLPWGDPLKVSRNELGTRLDALDELGALADVFNAREKHPWRGFGPAGVVRQDTIEAIESDLREISRTTQSMSDHLAVMASVIARHDTLSIKEIELFAPAFEGLSQVERLPEDWWNSSATELKDKADLFETTANSAAEFQEKETEYRKYLCLPFHDAVELLAPVESQFAVWYRRMLPSCWRWRSSVRLRLKPGARANFVSLRYYYPLAQRLVELENWLREHYEELAAEVGPAGVRNPETLRRTALEFRVAASLQQALAAVGRKPKEALSSVSAAVRHSAKELPAVLPSRGNQSRDAIKRVDAVWPDSFVDGVTVELAPLPMLRARAAEALGATAKIHEWLRLLRVLNRCKELGLSPFIEHLGDINKGLPRATFEKRFYRLCADAAIQNSESLADFSGPQRQELIEKFHSLDEKLRDFALKRIQAVASDAANKVKSAANLGDIGGEIGILRRELQKQKRFKPLRKLFAEIPHALQALKPCMLMSPISVSTFLKPGSCEFDLAVFDEASQLPTAETIPSILRAKQVVVAGDSNQLPPTSFFETSIFDESEEVEEDVNAAPEPLPSLLDDCKAIVPVFQESHLRWHYRSRDERLIKFSNHYFYLNGLITFPSASTDRTGRGVHLEYVPDGVWDRGLSRTNRAEALRVARLVVEHLDTWPERSLGVVAMNRSQKESIEDLLAEDLRDRPDVAALLNKNSKEAFFVKSLENVQGDERDTMIISVGYGKDADGHLTLNFGPLNMEGGWRRLNVLVTRAKWQTILVTSLRSTELTGINPQNRGALALKNFIEYAEREGELPHPPPTLTQVETNDFEDAVREALVQLGLAVDAQVGASKFRIDLAIRDRRDPRRYVLAVECDGASYHSSRTARDRDLLREQILRRMGWRIHRVWSTEWFHDPDGAILSILESLQQAEATPPEELLEVPVAETRDNTDEREPQQPRGDSRPDRGQAPPTRRYSTGEPYRKFRAESEWRDTNLLLRPVNVPKLAELVTAIANVEGPIHERLIVDRLKEVFGIDRISHDSTTAVNITRAINLAISDNRLRQGRNGWFLSKAGVPLAHFRLPNDGVERDVDQIAAEEIELAVLHLVEDQFGVQRERLPRAVAKLLGFRQLRADGAKLIHEIIDGLVERGLLRTSGFQVFVTPTK
jgi:very-short-patch-repair endonuclease/DNA polymerase III delta prime subunit